MPFGYSREVCRTGESDNGTIALRPRYREQLDTLLYRIDRLLKIGGEPSVVTPDHREHREDRPSVGRVQYVGLRRNGLKKFES